MVPVIVLLAIACAALGTMFVRSTGRKKGLKAAVLKGLTTCCCIAVGLISIFHTVDKRFAVLVVIGIFFGFLGDEFLAMRYIHPDKFKICFASGSAAFLIGHIFYIIALLGLVPSAWKIAIPVTIVLLIFEYYNSKRHKIDMNRLFVPGGLYMSVICFMCGCAIGSAVLGFDPGTLVFAIAGISFVTSDTILSVQYFGDTRSERNGHILHITYFLAQFLIGLTPLLIK